MIALEGLLTCVLCSTAIATLDSATGQHHYNFDYDFTVGYCSSHPVRLSYGARSQKVLYCFEFSSSLNTAATKLQAPRNSRHDTAKTPQQALQDFTPLTSTMQYHAEPSIPGLEHIPSPFRELLDADYPLPPPILLRIEPNEAPALTPSSAYAHLIGVNISQYDAVSVHFGSVQILRPAIHFFDTERIAVPIPNHSPGTVGVSIEVLSGLSNGLSFRFTTNTKGIYRT